MSVAKVAVIGCGSHARKNILPSLRFTDLDLVAVCDIDEEAANACGKRFGAPLVATDYRELLDRRMVDGVIVVVHASLHDEIATEAMRAGLHVFTEKPPSMSSINALACARVAKETGKTCMTAFKKRYAPAYCTARNIMLEKMPPGHRHMEYTYCFSHYNVGHRDPAQAFLLDAGIHAIDFVCHLMGAVTRLACFKSGSDGIESYAVAMRFEDGSAGTLNLSSRAAPGDGCHEFLKITGNQTTVFVDNVVSLEAFYPDRTTQTISPRYVSSGNWVEVTTGFAGELQAFEKLLLDGTRPSSTIDASYRSMVVYEAIKAANEEPATIKYEEI
ncbi:MAG: Gfo/Idh/MocA family oxidoreductase [Nitrospiraceae bacterium]|nr:Gfo/Idh/MocA family oxidoreductase [Nitrospiraceae bacterium]